MYPQYLFEYPNMNTDFPFYMKKKRYTTVPPHRHDFIELSFVLEGKGSEFINGAEHDMLPGTIVLLLPYQIHHYRAHADNSLLMYTCNFNMELLTEGAESAWGLRDFILGRDGHQAAYIQLGGEAYLEGKRIWDNLYREYEDSLPWKSILLKALLLEALTLFARSSGIASRQGHLPDDISVTKKARSLWPIVQYVHDHYLEPLTLSLLSERFQVHPAHMSKLFGEQYGIHFVDFLHELRIRHACSLLITSDMPITQIAFESGFSSYPTFSRVFLRIKGITPREYRDKRTG
jgi:AraC-like DNA-binding protein